MAHGVAELIARGGVSDPEGELHRTVGDSNGWTVSVFKLNLVAIPIALTSLIALNVWLVTSVFEVQSKVALVEQQVAMMAAAGPRYSAVDARADRVELKESIVEYIQANYPPKWLRDAVDSLETRMDALESRVYENHRPGAGM